MSEHHPLVVDSLVRRFGGRAALDGAFNAWAMDGFLKVFWYNSPDKSIVVSILKEVGVILSMAAVFFSIACVAARRWAVR